MATRPERMAVINHFAKGFHSLVQKKLIINRNKEQWAADNLLESYGKEDLYAVMDRYLATCDTPTWRDFTYVVDEIYDTMKAEAEDRRQRELAKNRFKEWIA